MIDAQDFLLEFELKTKLIETDLLYYVYSVRNPADVEYRFWFPCSPVYSSHGAPPLFNKIKYDEKFGAAIAKQLFDTDYATLLDILKAAKEFIHNNLRSAYFGSFGAENVLDIF